MLRAIRVCVFVPKSQGLSLPEKSWVEKEPTKNFWVPNLDDDGRDEDDAISQLVREGEKKEDGYVVAYEIK